MGSPSFSDVRMLSSQVGVALLLCFLCTVSAENARKPKILFGSISSSTTTTTSTVTTATASYCYTIKATITTACGKRKKRFIDDMGETELALKPSSASNPQVDLDASVDEDVTRTGRLFLTYTSTSTVSVTATTTTSYTGTLTISVLCVPGSLSACG